MKPIAIIAIIAAVVVVGGACAGVAFSGVLNGGTTGPGGDDPVVPTEPVAPTETPTETPTDSSMSYFSPMTSSSSSSSSSGSSPSVPPTSETPTETPTEPTSNTIKVENGGEVSFPADAISGSTISSMILPAGENRDIILTPIASNIATPEEKTYMAVDIELIPELSPGESATIKFTVPLADLTARGLTPDSVRLYHYDASSSVWTPLSTVCTDEAVASYEATATEFSPFAVILCEHETWQYSVDSISSDKHTKTCPDCMYSVEEPCNYEGAEYVTLAGDEHQRTCTICGLTVETDECQPADTYSSALEKHWKDCNLCGDPLVEGAGDCTFTNGLVENGGSYVKNNDVTKSTHEKNCTICGAIYTEACTSSTGKIVPTAGSNDTHGGECDFCGKTLADAKCELVWVHDGGDAVTHSKKCESCGRTSAVETEKNQSCEFTYTWSIDKDEHTGTCKLCGYEKSPESCTYMAQIAANDVVQVDGQTHKSKPCETCENVKENIPCTYGEFAKSSETEHSKACTGCGYTITKSCTYVEKAEKYDEAGKHTYACTEPTCENVKTEECKDTATYTLNADNTHTLTCDECGTVLQSNVACFNTETCKDDLKSEPPTRTCECGRTADLEASVTTSSGTTTYYFSVEEAITAAAETEGTDVVTLWKDINLEGVTWTSISNFADTFDGNGKTISNLKDAALFGTITETGVVKNLNLKDVSANAPIGGFLASTLNGRAEYCSVKNATVTSDSVGSSGMFGFAGVTAVIDHCSVDGFTLTVTNTGDNRDKTGGLVGQSSGAMITNSAVSNIELNGVYKTKEWGGFVGRHANDGLIEGCTATNVKINVTDYAQSVGGFVGAPANAYIKNCDVNGVTIEVNSGGHVGGFCGYTGQANYYNFENCHVTGLSITLKTDTVSGIGGFSGRAAFTTTIKDCSAEGEIHASATAIAGGNIKALVGQEYEGGSVYEGNIANVQIN